MAEADGAEFYIRRLTDEDRDDWLSMRQALFTLAFHLRGHGELDVAAPGFVVLARSTVQVRCGLHVGELLFDEHTPLELLSDRVLDLTGHLQKAARPNALLVSSTVYEQIRDKAGFQAARRAPLAQDASFRRYWRLTGGPVPAVLMDAPPPDDIRPFLRIAAHLATAG